MSATPVTDSGRAHEVRVLGTGGACNTSFLVEENDSCLVTC